MGSPQKFDEQLHNAYLDKIHSVPTATTAVNVQSALYTSKSIYWHDGNNMAQMCCSADPTAVDVKPVQCRTRDIDC